MIRYRRNKRNMRIKWSLAFRNLDYCEEALEPAVCETTGTMDTYNFGEQPDLVDNA